MDLQKLITEIKQKKSYLCVGLDTEFEKIPKHLLKSKKPILEFNKSIINATKKYCVAYKLNIAFYEQYGSKGWDIIEKTIEHIPSDIFIIADSKRGDIGNTAKMYARTFFETYNFDAVTVSPYMGLDTLQPFLEYKNKFTIVLALTSNEGSSDFQMLDTPDGKLYEVVIKKVAEYANELNIMFVTGATKADKIVNIRKLVPEHFLLVPGVGAQGGDFSEVSENGFNKNCGLLINSSRNIIYASNDENFEISAEHEAIKLQSQMEQFLIKKGFIK